jgi:inorganic triphosphatase YgiF
MSNVIAMPRKGPANKGPANSRMKEIALEQHDSINFGDISEEINDILQEGVAAYRRDKKRADELFRQALAAAPTELPVYYCLYKIHTYQGNLDDAVAMAESGLKEGARQAGWPLDWHEWQPQPESLDGPGRFALYTLKALAFISLRRDEQERARHILDTLKWLDPTGQVGWPVIAALADGLAEG